MDVSNNYRFLFTLLIITIMQLLSRREYNLILRALDKYELYMNQKEKELSETLQDKLYYNLYNPKDGVAQTNSELSDFYDNISDYVPFTK